jgi:hypothetical protein
MKLTVRIFAILVVAAGVAAAATTPKSVPMISSHQSATDKAPFPPPCDPDSPFACPEQPGGGGNPQ